MNVILNAQKRDPSSKASQLRKKGLVPCSLYGKSVEASSICIEQKELSKWLKLGAKKIDVKFGSQTYHAAIEEVQRDSISNQIFHVSFHAFSSNEKITMDIPIHVIGKALGQTQGGVLKQQMQSITVYGFAKDLPEHFEVNVSKLDLGHSLHIGDLNFKGKFEIKDAEDKVLIACHYPKIQVSEEASEAELTTEPIEESISKAA